MRAHRAHLTPAMAERARNCHSGLDGLGDGNGWVIHAILTRINAVLTLFRTLEEAELRHVDKSGSLFGRIDRFADRSGHVTIGAFEAYVGMLTGEKPRSADALLREMEVIVINAY